jgi:hypothetical protein
MSKQAIKNLMLFLFINLLIAIVIVFNDYYTEKVNLRKKQLAATQTQTVATQVPNMAITETKQGAIQPSSTPQVNPAPIVNENKTNSVESTSLSNNTSSVCIVMGPFNLEEKGTVDFILNKSKESQLAEVEKKSPYKIFWDLGKDQDVAEKLFKVQKEGAMSDSRFELVQNSNGNWVVDITTIKGSKSVVEKLTKDLAIKANKLNAGGDWKYEQMKESYFYTFKQYNQISPNTIKNIEVLLKPKKEPC